MPFLEEGCEPILKKWLKKRILATSKFEQIKNSKYIIICIGTPVNNKQKPELKKFISLFLSIKKYLTKDQIVIIRSSVGLGTCEKVYDIIKDKCKNLSYCPERIAQGKSITELLKFLKLFLRLQNMLK